MSASKKKLARREAALNDVTLTEKQKQQQKQDKVHKRNVILGSVVAAILVVLVVLLLVWNSGFFARHTTAVTVNGVDYSVADMEFYYHLAMNNTYQNQQYYVQLYSQMGVTDYGPLFDPQLDPADQIVDPDAEERQTYHDLFLETAKNNLSTTAALYDAAKAEGYTLSEDAQTELDSALTSLDQAAKNNNCANRGAYLRLAYGSAMTEDVYLRNLEKNILAADYQTSKTNAIGSNYSEDDLLAYYDEHSDTLDSYDYDYVFFTGVPASNTDAATGEKVEPTDAEKQAAMAEAKEKAEAVLAAAKAGSDDDTDPLKTAAEEQGASLSSRPRTLGNSVSAMPFAEWLMDESRKEGDLEMSESEDSGYYVVRYGSRYRDDSPLVDVRHILIATNLTDDPETEADERLDSTNETVIAKRAEAQAILDEFLAGDKTAETFGELAEEHSEDDRSGDDNALSTAGGLYTNVHTGDMVANFNDWCFDESRKSGDTGLVLTEFGWHIMYFQESHPASWKTSAESSKKSEEQTAWLESVTEGYDPVDGSGLAQVGK